MSRNESGCSMGFLLTVGVILFLAMEHPLVFWAILVPTAVVLIGGIIRKFRL